MRAVVLLIIYLALSSAYKVSNHRSYKNDLKTKDDNLKSINNAIKLWLKLHHLDHHNVLKNLLPNLFNKPSKYGLGNYQKYAPNFDENDDSKKLNKYKQTSSNYNSDFLIKEYESIEDEESKSNNGFNQFTTKNYEELSEIDENLSDDEDNGYSSDEEEDLHIIYLTPPKPSHVTKLDDYVNHILGKTPKKHDKNTYNSIDNENSGWSGDRYKEFKNRNPLWTTFRGKQLRCKDKSMRQCVGDENEKEKKIEVKKEEIIKKIEAEKWAEFYSKNPRVTARPDWNENDNYYARTGQTCTPSALNLVNFKPRSSCRVCFCDLDGVVKCKIDEICVKQSIRTGGQDPPPFCDHKMCFRQCLLTKMRAGACRNDICTCL